MRVVLSLAKPRYHLSYVAVIAAALLFGPAADDVLVARLTALFISFSMLFYSGIYIFNDIADARADAAHPGKRKRPIPAGRISARNAAMAAAALVTAGLLTAALLFPPPIVGAYLVALALNVAYSAGGRNLPYLDIALNSAPHAVRFLIGVLMVGRTPPVGHLVAWFCVAGGVACIRRLVELESGSVGNRPVLSHYSPRGLALAVDSGFLMILGLCALDGLQSPGFYLIAISAYLCLFLVLAARRYALAQDGGAWLWLR